MVALDGEDPVVLLTCARRVGRPVVEHASAPSERTKSAFSALHTAVTSAPMSFAIWTANGPTLPDAPSISTRSPDRIDRPFRRRSPWRARIPECGRVAASSNDRPSGIVANARSGAAAYSANAPCANGYRSREDAVALLEPGHARPDGVDDAGHVDADALDPRRAESGRCSRHPGHAVEKVEVDPIGRRRDDPDDDDIAAGLRAFDIANLDDRGGTVAIANRRPHSPACWPIVTTTLPLAWPSSTQRSASTTSSSG